MVDEIDKPSTVAALWLATVFVFFTEDCLCAARLLALRADNCN
jgi:hypothetical protein